MIPLPVHPFARAAALLMSVACLASPVRADTPTLAPGRVVPAVACRSHPDQTYAVYLPSGYTPDRSWPILYCFDPMARGQLPVERFKDAAERHGYIVAGSNNSRNGPWPAIASAANAMMQDADERFHLDARRRYLAGFSGGARAACAIAGELGLPGVIACSGSFSDSTPAADISYAFFGTTGTEDFNYQELEQVRAVLTQRQHANRVVVFDGTHEWLPAELTTPALAWLDLQAMRTGLLPRNDAWLRAQFAQRLQAAEVQPDARIAALGLRALISDFAGLLDTSAATAKADALERSRQYRKAKQTERRSAQQEQQWMEDIAMAIAEARLGRPRRNAVEVARELRQMAGGDSNDFDRRDPFGEPVTGSQPALEAASYLMAEATDRQNDGDRYAGLRTLVTRIREKSDREIAARRVLRSAFSNAFERGRSLLLGGKAAEAAESLTIATVIEPTYARAHFELACALTLQGDRQAANQSLLAALAHGYDNKQRIQQLHLALASGNQDAQVLDPFFFSEAPDLVTSFGLALQLLANPETHLLERVVVRSVAGRSEAAGKGVSPGTEIRAINGRSIHGFLAQFGPNSEFGQLFMNRRDGDRIVLELAAPNSAASRTVVLTQGFDENASGLPWQLPESF